MRCIAYERKIWNEICSNVKLFKIWFEFHATCPFFWTNSSLNECLLFSYLQIMLDVSCYVWILSLFSTIADAVDVYAINTPNIVQLTRRICRQQRIATQNHRDQRKCIGWRKWKYKFFAIQQNDFFQQISTGRCYFARINWMDLLKCDLSGWSSYE